MNQYNDKDSQTAYRLRRLDKLSLQSHTVHVGADFCIHDIKVLRRVLSSRYLSDLNNSQPVALYCGLVLKNERKVAISSLLGHNRKHYLYEYEKNLQALQTQRLVHDIPLSSRRTEAPSEAHPFSWHKQEIGKWSYRRIHLSNVSWGRDALAVLRPLLLLFRTVCKPSLVEKYMWE